MRHIKVDFSNEEIKLLEDIINKAVRISLNIWMDLLQEAEQINPGNPKITDDMRRQWIHTRILQDIYDKITDRSYD